MFSIPPAKKISIHALLAESDLEGGSDSGTSCNFYPRSPCGERLCVCWMALNRPLFLSTLSLRRATAIDVFLAVWAVISIHALLAESDLGRGGVVLRMSNFYPRSPCGERQDTPLISIPKPGISIHALLAESDVASVLAVGRAGYFYPRSPCGERLNDAINGCNPDFISIHALLAESDADKHVRQPKRQDFYPRSPCGERRFWACSAGFAR